jgi:hypothetical protein
MTPKDRDYINTQFNRWFQYYKGKSRDKCFLLKEFYYDYAMLVMFWDTAYRAKWFFGEMLEKYSKAWYYKNNPKLLNRVTSA